MALAVRRPRDEDELAAALALREEVFCGEQGVVLAGDRDGRDYGERFDEEGIEHIGMEKRL